MSACVSEDSRRSRQGARLDLYLAGRACTVATIEQRTFWSRRTKSNRVKCRALSWLCCSGAAKSSKTVRLPRGSGAVVAIYFGAWHRDAEVAPRSSFHRSDAQFCPKKVGGLCTRNLTSNFLPRTTTTPVLFLSLIRSEFTADPFIMAKITTLPEFEAVFPQLVEDLLEQAKQYNLPEDFVQWYKNVRDTSCPQRVPKGRQPC